MRLHSFSGNPQISGHYEMMKPSTKQILSRLVAQAVKMWPEDDKKRLRKDLRSTAADIVEVAQYRLEQDVEPHFFGDIHE